MSMKIAQLDLFNDPVIFAKEIKMGDTFLFSNRICMRTKPVSWMLNSTLIQDKITRGFIFATDLESGKFCTIDRNFKVEKVSCTLQWRRDK